MPNKVLKVGIAGQGRSGYAIHARWLREAPGQYRIVAVADQLEERRAQASREFGCRVYDDYEKLVSDRDLDLFVNALPSHLHPQGTIAALEAGHPVVCEKPFAVTVEDADRVIAAARKSGKLLAPFQNSRFYPFFAEMQKVIQSGKLGQIVYIRSNWGGFSRRWDWQTRQEFWGGSLNNTGPHPMDQAIMLFGEGTPKVFCRMECRNPFGGDADDFCLVVLYGRNAPTIEVMLSSYQAYPQGEMYNVSGTLGGLAGGPDGLKWKYFDPEKAPKQAMWRPWSENRNYCSEKLPWIEENWSAAPDADSFQDNSRAFYNNVYDALVKGAQLVVTPEQVRRQVAVIQECHRQSPLPVKR
jgi:scyllo-inositol 2-dehydrogenase (NADP+)